MNRSGTVHTETTTSTVMITVAMSLIRSTLLGIMLHDEHNSLGSKCEMMMAIIKMHNAQLFTILPLEVGLSSGIK